MSKRIDPSPLQKLFVAIVGRLLVDNDNYLFRCETCKDYKLSLPHGYSNSKLFLECDDCGYRMYYYE